MPGLPENRKAPVVMLGGGHRGFSRLATRKVAAERSRFRCRSVPQREAHASRKVKHGVCPAAPILTCSSCSLGCLSPVFDAYLADGFARQPVYFGYFRFGQNSERVSQTGQITRLSCSRPGFSVVEYQDRPISNRRLFKQGKQAITSGPLSPNGLISRLTNGLINRLTNSLTNGGVS